MYNWRIETCPMVKPMSNSRPKTTAKSSNPTDQKEQVFYSDAESSDSDTSDDESYEVKPTTQVHELKQVPDTDVIETRMDVATEDDTIAIDTDKLRSPTSPSVPEGVFCPFSAEIPLQAGMTYTAALRASIGMYLMCEGVRAYFSSDDAENPGLDAISILLALLAASTLGLLTLNGIKRHDYAVIEDKLSDLVKKSDTLEKEALQAQARVSKPYKDFKKVVRNVKAIDKVIAKQLPKSPNIGKNYFSAKSKNKPIKITTEVPSIPVQAVPVATSHTYKCGVTTLSLFGATASLLSDCVSINTLKNVIEEYISEKPAAVWSISGLAAAGALALNAYAFYDITKGIERYNNIMQDLENRNNKLALLTKELDESILQYALHKTEEKVSSLQQLSAQVADKFSQKDKLVSETDDKDQSSQQSSVVAQKRLKARRKYRACSLYHRLSQVLGVLSAVGSTMGANYNLYKLLKGNEEGISALVALPLISGLLGSICTYKYSSQGRDLGIFRFDAGAAHKNKTDLHLSSADDLIKDICKKTKSIRRKSPNLFLCIDSQLKALSELAEIKSNQSSPIVLGQSPGDSPINPFFNRYRDYREEKAYQPINQSSSPDTDTTSPRDLTSPNDLGSPPALETQTPSVTDTHSFDASADTESETDRLKLQRSSPL
jgi:hypothetical protein